MYPETDGQPRTGQLESLRDSLLTVSCTVSLLFLVSIQKSFHTPKWEQSMRLLWNGVPKGLDKILSTFSTKE